MRNLFLKIFLWFWIGLILVGAALVLSSVWTTSHRLEEGWRRRIGSAMHLYTRTLAEEIDARGPSAAVAVAARLEHDEHIGLDVIDAAGNDLAHPGVHPPEPVVRLARRAAMRRRPAFRRWRGRLLIAHRIPGPESTGPVAVFLLPRHPRLYRLVRTRTLMLRLALILIIGTVLCYGLARYLTSPIRTLRAATKELAAGNLGVRVGDAVGARRDEIGELAQDFDRMAERLEEMVHSQTRLLRDVSHELRSPLARLNVALDLARHKPGAPTGEMLDRIGVEADRLNALIGQLLDLTRLESGDRGSWERIALHTLVAQVVADADFEARAKGARVELDSAGPLTMHGSPALVRSAIENVVRNAVAHAPHGSPVHVALSQEAGGDAVVTVRDHGVGVPDRLLERLFDPFFRVDPSRERSGGGAGLGLAITRRAVAAHNGHVTASNAPGGGLIVTIRFPREARAGTPGSPEA